LIIVGLLSNNSFGQLSNKLNEAIRGETIEKLSKMLSDSYVYPETGKKMAKQLNDNLKNGKYDNIEEFGQFGASLVNDLYEISKDKHLAIYYSPSQVEDIKKLEMLSESEKEEHTKKEIENSSKTNFGFENLEILSSNVGYLKLSRFDMVNSASSETAFTAMKFLANTDAMIIDLRENSGGYPTMVQLLGSCFYDYQEDENTILFTSHIPSTGEVIPYRVLPGLPVKRMVKTPLYILVNKNSISAAEIFAYNLQKLGRSIIIGEQTNFGVNGTKGPEILNDYFIIKLPFETSINPITKTNCEGVGVIPDIKTEGVDALDKAMDIIRAKQNEGKHEKESIAADERYMEYIGEYELNPEIIMTISVQGVQVFVGVTGRPQPFEVFPMEKDKFNIPGFGIEVTFLRENDIVTGLNFSRNGNENYAKKVK